MALVWGDFWGFWWDFPLFYPIQKVFTWSRAEPSNLMHQRLPTARRLAAGFHRSLINCGI